MTSPVGRSPAPSPAEDALHARLDEFLACPDCDLLARRTEVPRGGRAFCPRCGVLLFRGRVRVVERTLALSLAALLLFAAAVTLPFLELRSAGQIQVVTLPDCARAFAEQGSPVSAVLVAFTGIFAPGLLLGGLLHLALGLHLRRVWPGLYLVARSLQRLQPWAMADVLLLGVLVSLLKLARDFELIFRAGSYAFVGLVVVLAAALAAYEPEAIWRRLDERGARPVPAPEPAG